MPIPIPSAATRKRLAGIVMLVGGVGLIVAGFWFNQRTIDFLDRANVAPGIVVDTISKRSSKGQKLYYAVVEFAQPVSGKTIRFQSKAGLWPVLFESGEAVEVVYDPDNPDDAEINSFWTLWFLSSLAIAFGAVLIAAGTFSLRR